MAIGPFEIKLGTLRSHGHIDFRIDNNIEI